MSTNNDASASHSRPNNIVHGFIMGHGKIINKEYVVVPSNFDVFVHTERGEVFHKNIPIENINNNILNRQSHSKHLIPSGTIMEDMLINTNAFLYYNEEESRRRGVSVLTDKIGSTNISLFTHSGIILDIPTPTHKRPNLTSFYDLTGNASVHTQPDVNGVFQITPGVYGWLIKNTNGTFKKSEVKILNNWINEEMKTRYEATRPLNMRDIEKIKNISFGSHNRDILSLDVIKRGMDGNGGFRLGYLFKQINEYIKSHTEFNEYKVIIHIYTCRSYKNSSQPPALRRLQSFNQGYLNTFGNFKEKISTKIKSIKGEFNGLTNRSPNKNKLNKIIQTYSFIIKSYNKKLFFTKLEFEFMEYLIEDNMTGLIELSNNFIFNRIIQYDTLYFSGLHSILNITQFLNFKPIEEDEDLFSVIDYLMDFEKEKERKWSVLNSILIFYQSKNMDKLRKILKHYQPQFPNRIGE